MLDLWRWRFDFLLRRRDRLHFGSRFRSGYRLTMGRRHGSRLGRRFRLLLLSRRYGGVSSRRSLR
jgi:hypothetical protein